MVQLLYAKIQDWPEAVQVSADQTTAVEDPTDGSTSMEDQASTAVTDVTDADAILVARAEHAADAPSSVY